MTVIFSKKCELGLQAVLFLSAQNQSMRFNASEISKNLKVPKEFVSKVLQLLTYKGIVGSQKGKNGGFFLAKKPEDVKLIEIVEAIDGLDMFNNCVLGFKDCGCGNPCPVHNKWGKLRDKTFKMLSEEDLGQLLKKTKNKIDSL
ncbi:MAG: Rrf2 family transcriptional regulator [Rhodothermaceae bacterium]